MAFQTQVNAQQAPACAATSLRPILAPRLFLRKVASLPAPLVSPLVASRGFSPTA